MVVVVEISIFWHVTGSKFFRPPLKKLPFLDSQFGLMRTAFFTKAPEKLMRGFPCSSAFSPNSKAIR